MTLYEDMEKFVGELEEDAKNCSLATREKTKHGDWNYSEYDRHAMAAEARLMNNIAKSLRIILGTHSMTVCGEQRQ